MSGLLISLKPNEKFLVNGTLLANGPKRSQIQVGNDVNVLRLSDAIHPDQVTTPLKRIYYSTQIILSGDAEAKDVEADIQSGLKALAAVFENTPISKVIEKADRAAKSGRFYSLLNFLKTLLKLEDDLLARSALPATAGHMADRSTSRLAMSA